MPVTSTQPVLDLYIRIVANHELELFWDVDGKDPIDINSPPISECRGKIRFHFIVNNNFGHHWNGGRPNIETAALVVIAQTETDPSTGRVKRGTPFAVKGGNDRCFYLEDPDPSGLGNVSGTANSLIKVSPSKALDFCIRLSVPLCGDPSCVKGMRPSS